MSFTAEQWMQRYRRRRLTFRAWTSPAMQSASLFRESGSTQVCYDSPTTFEVLEHIIVSSSSSHILSLFLSLFLLNRRSVLSHCLHFPHFLHLLHPLLCQRRGALYCMRHTILLSPHLAQNTCSPQWLLRMPKLRQRTQTLAYLTTSATPMQFSKTTTLNGAMVGLPITLIPERSTKKVGPFIPAPHPFVLELYLPLHRNLQVISATFGRVLSISWKDGRRRYHVFAFVVSATDTAEFHTHIAERGHSRHANARHVVLPPQASLLIHLHF